MRTLAVLIGSTVMASLTIGWDPDGKSSNDGPWPYANIGHRQSRPKRHADCRSLECRSLCPWHYVQDKKNGRKPRSISKAECLRKSCDYNFDGLGQIVKDVLNFYTECEPVYTKIKVWQDGFEEWTQWPIACTCSRVRSRSRMKTNFGDGFRIPDHDKHISVTTGSLRQFV